ncbi:hypothetical protein MNO14_13585 [Luteimonas sp. S4-F44]|uniref:hypothetical protein n=1 Tax=Luteimonas sp. S4-F44 TaxID=2925842 RepID=UPI001F52E3D5|nr:hypothetical protein [Luteimonas sp. S4-F44]UNK41972.1 hypothetical protein MNO14_13585 [Luteimonas sp. S4-F44]
MSIRAMFCALLLAACLPAAAREARVPGPSDVPPCAAAPAASAPEAAGGDAVRRPPPASASKTRPATSGGIESDGPLRGPRWHSFLPGMFR